MSDLSRRAWATLNRLCKWRAHFAGWQLGTRLKGDPEADAVRDTQERLLLLRVEVTALTKLMLDRGLVTQDDLQAAIILEAEALMQLLERRWPGIRAIATMASRTTRRSSVVSVSTGAGCMGGSHDRPRARPRAATYGHARRAELVEPS